MGTSEGFTGQPGEVTSESGRIGQDVRPTDAQRRVLSAIVDARRRGEPFRTCWPLLVAEAAAVRVQDIQRALDALSAARLIQTAEWAYRIHWAPTDAGLAAVGAR